MLLQAIELVACSIGFVAEWHAIVDMLECSRCGIRMTAARERASDIELDVGTQRGPLFFEDGGSRSVLPGSEQRVPINDGRITLIERVGVFGLKVFQR